MAYNHIIHLGQYNSDQIEDIIIWVVQTLQKGRDYEFSEDKLYEMTPKYGGTTYPAILFMNKGEDLTAMKLALGI